VIETPNQIARLLNEGEHVAWVGRPALRKVFAPGDWYCVPFSAVWAGLAVWGLFIARPASSTAQPCQLPICLDNGFCYPAQCPPAVHSSHWPQVIGAVVFAVAALYVTVGRFLRKAWRKSRTVYALTDRRAIALVGHRYSDETLRIAVTFREGKFLTAVFGRPTRTSWWSYWIGANTGLGNLDFTRRFGAPLAFFDVADVQGLKAALRAVQPEIFQAS
jgi:hypothetical protein